MKIAVINGPNLNLLGQRTSRHYGEMTLSEINELIEMKYPEINFTFLQSNHEGQLIDLIQVIECDGLIINPGGYSHTSVSILDALDIRKIPKVEVHLSDISSREDFRSKSITSLGCDYIISGKKESGYFDAVDYIKGIITK